MNGRPGILLISGLIWLILVLHLNLQACDVSNGKSKDTADKHPVPKCHRREEWEFFDSLKLSEKCHQGQKEEASIDVVVEGKTPDVVVYKRQDFLGEDGIESYTGTGHHTKHNSDDRQGT